MKSKFLVLGLVTGAIGLGGCGIVHDYNKYELESPSDTTEIRHYKNICVNQRNGAACYYVYENGTYLSEEMRDKYLQAGCSLGYEKACTDARYLYISYKDKCINSNDLDSCYKLDNYPDYLEPSVISLVERNCNLYKIGESCQTVANYYHQMKHNYDKDANEHSIYLNKSIEYAEKGCNLNHRDSCGNLAEYIQMKYSKEYSEGNKERKNYLEKKVRGITEKACRLEDYNACDDLKYNRFFDYWEKI